MKLQKTDIQSTLSSSLELIEKCFAENEEKQFKIRDCLRLLETKRVMSKKAINDAFRRILKLEDELMRDLDESVESKGESLRILLHKLEVSSETIKEKREHINNLMRGKISEDLEDNIENIHRSILEISFKSNESVGPVDVLEFVRSEQFEKLFKKEGIGYIRQLATIPDDLYFVKHGDTMVDVEALCCLDLVCKQDCPTLRDHLKCRVEDQDRKTIAHTFKRPQEGRYVVQFVPLKLGYYNVCVTMYGQQVGDSPLQVYVTPPLRRSGSKFGKAFQNNSYGSLSYTTSSYESGSGLQARYDTERVRYPKQQHSNAAKPCTLQSVSDYRISRSYVMDDKGVVGMELVKDRNLSNSSSFTSSGSSGHVSKFKISTDPRITYSKDFLMYCGSLPVTQVIKDDLKKHKIILKDFDRTHTSTQSSLKKMRRSQEGGGFRERAGMEEPNVPTPSPTDIGGAVKAVADDGIGQRMDCGDSCLHRLLYDDNPGTSSAGVNQNSPRDVLQTDGYSKGPSTSLAALKNYPRDPDTCDVKGGGRLAESVSEDGTLSVTPKTEDEDDDNVIYGKKLKALIDSKGPDTLVVSGPKALLDKSPGEGDATVKLTKRYSDELCNCKGPKRSGSSTESEAGRPSSALSGLLADCKQPACGKKTKCFITGDGTSVSFKSGSDKVVKIYSPRSGSSTSVARDSPPGTGAADWIWNQPEERKESATGADDSLVGKLDALDENVRRLSLTEIFGEVRQRRPQINVHLKSLISSNVLRGPGIDADLVLQIGKWGKGILGTFNFPIGITVCPFTNNIIICDSGNDKIKIFDENGNQEVVIGTSTKERRFTRPSAAVVLNNGNICIKDDFRLQVYTPTGKFVQAFGGGHVNRPYGLGVTKQGWVVTCCYTFPDPTLQFYDSETGKLVKQSPLYTICGSWRQGSKCRFLAVHDDWIAITDLGKHLVYLVDFDGKPHAIFGGHNTNNHVDLIEPSGIAVDSDGMLAIADSKSDRIHVYDKAGSYVCPLRTTKGGSLVSLSKPADMCFGPDGCLYIVNLLGHNTMKFKFGKD